MLEGIWRDFAYAWRRHRRHPALALAIGATLALAIGLNASVFVIYEAVALRPWAVPGADHLVNIYTSPPDRPRGSAAIGASLAHVRLLDADATLLDGVAATRELSLQFADGDEAPASPAQMVTGNFFRVLTVDMARGRGFLPEEDVPSSPQAVVVLSHRTWQRRFGGNEGIVGTCVRLDSVPFTVVGVAPPGFGGTSDREASAWVPFASLQLLRPLDKSVGPLLVAPAWCCSSVFGRLRPGVTAGRAAAQLESVSATFARQHGLEAQGIALTDTALLSHPGFWDKASLVFGLLQAAMLIVLLVACGNVGNLLLARAVERQHEIGTRLSLGATRARLVRQLLVESVVPAAAGGALGLAVAQVAPAWLFSQMMDTAPNIQLTPGVASIAFTMVATVGSVFAFGLAPALHATRPDLTSALRNRAWGPRLRLRGVLLAAQVAGCVVMLVCAALMLRGIQAVSGTDPGFRVEGIDLMQFDVPASAYGEAQVGALVQTLRAWQRAGSVNAALTRTPPLANARYSTSVRRQDEPVEADRSTDVHQVDPGYFAVLGMPLVAGRLFPTSGSDEAVLVNETFARRWLGGSGAVGTAIVLGGKNVRGVVGVVRDAHLRRLDAVDPVVFEPLSPTTVPRLLLPSTPGLAGSVVAAVQHLDSRIRVRTTPMQEVVYRHLDEARLASRLAATLGLVALVLAILGVSGVCGYLVRQRTREIGIRVALGATPSHVLSVVLGTVARATSWGLGVGALVAVVIANAAITAVPGVRVDDATAYLGAATALVLGGLAAAYVPARRALGLDPSRALREE
ncbi:Macrolide export ATP-binding/permease protein MacB [Luteitalea pratensis]|uniref:Macrolide export ATP-binding/permease protein MacB n=1 Tax=Luteitalea pratensis TaxID=1855912 RepID=A0A143PGW2_LUTPR|nr:Macrolide export ATP-binding/permease protein MacB [Luteitalea pratensis]